MDGNTAYKHADVKGSGLLKKLSSWKSYFTEEDMPRVSESGSLLESLQQARQEWLRVAENFDQAENEDMIDYYIYRMKACQVRYNYLLKKAKEMGLRRDIHETQ